MLHSARAIVTHFKYSVSSMKSLHSAQKTLGMKQKTLLQDEPTRWDSTYMYNVGEIMGSEERYFYGFIIC
jgi:hypothetical protein